MPSRSQSLTQTPSLAQRLTPMQVQLGHMLEMSGAEVEEVVRQALDEMPALEAVAPEEAHANDNTEDGAAFTESGNDIQRADFRSEDDMPDYLNRTSDSALYGPVSVYKAPGSYPSEYAEIPVADDGVSLYEFLRRQLSELPLSADEEAVASYIIGNIDDNGYLTRSASSIANDLAINEGLDVSSDLVKRMIEVVRSLDPPGIGAANLQECMLLQLRRMPRTTASVTAIEILSNHFDLFSKKHFDRMSRALDIELPRLKEALELIGRLNPKPASAISSGRSDERSLHISPDFFVEADPSGVITVSSLSRIPELRVEASFNAGDLAPAPSSSDASARRMEEANVFLRSKRDEARNFIRLLSMRQDTLFKVVNAIVRLQHDFFTSDEDEEMIRPMVLRNVADLTGLDQSVISRATKDKYIATPHGVYPLSKFFNEELRRSSASDSSSQDKDNLTYHRVVARIREIIEGEDAARPLSDQEITDLLNADGFSVARRTVAKYRENLGYPVQRLRKSLS